MRVAPSAAQWREESSSEGSWASVYRENLDAAPQPGLKRGNLEWSVDLHVYVLLLLRALHERIVELALIDEIPGERLQRRGDL